MKIEKKPVAPIYEYHLILSEDEARELKDTLGDTHGSDSVFDALCDSLKEFY